VTRLVGQYLKNSEVKEAVYRRNRFQRRFTQADIELLAKVDEAHETLSGPATRKIREREWAIYKHAGYERLATVSVAHIYNLRKRRRYRECRLNYTKTQAVPVAIGERRKPEPGGSARLPGCRYRAPGRPGRDQGEVPHRRRRRSDAVAGDRRRGSHQPGASGAGFTGDFPHTFPFPSAVFIPTTARSLSTTPSPACSESC
jgi:hypothetical protein